MRNKKVIIVNGMQRGGTNIVWNLLQSHPNIVSPIYETGQIIFPQWMQRGRIGRATKHFARTLIRVSFVPYLNYIDSVFYKYKMSSLNNEDNKYKNEHEIYTKTELEEAILVSKSVGDDIFIAPILSTFFRNTYCVSVIRNGLAVCEGWIRRGASPEKAAKAYRRTMIELLKQDKSLENNLIVKFEDCLRDPAGQLTRMCCFVGADPDEIDKIRIKAKRTIDQKGVHSTAFGTEGRKIWLAKEDINQYLDESVTNRQIQKLSNKQKETILKIAGKTMRRLGYDAR